ncbi:hypothetical protein EV668_1486 [Enterovirga rhinocerotis]|uniref:Uncharacterized protein n=2 Tax=Enterovirga rhinocerotis TaxID=1339210 RepID=A0A4R7CAY4_9HYPH|nr:hypothetical protein EV668_1486 [Enterovirga rhinocerotis]
MTVPEFAAFMQGFAAFHGADETPEAPSADAWQQALQRDALGRDAA